MTSATSAISCDLTLYRASERLAIASCKRCSRANPSKSGSESVALKERGDLVKLNGNLELPERIACASASRERHCAAFGQLIGEVESGADLFCADALARDDSSDACACCTGKFGVRVAVRIAADAGRQRERRRVLALLAAHAQIGDVLARAQRDDAGILVAGRLDQLLQIERHRSDRELAHQLHVGRLRYAHSWKRRSLSISTWFLRLEHLDLLQSERHFGALNVELRTGADDLAGLSENELLLRGDDERIL